MTQPVETIRQFYSAIAAGDIGKLAGLMSSDIERNSVVDFNVQGRGPEEVIKKVFAPLMQEWESFSPNPSEFHSEGLGAVSLYRFACIHRATGKRADLPYGHIWNVRDGKIEGPCQYIDTLALEQVRHLSVDGVTV